MIKGMLASLGTVIKKNITSGDHEVQIAGVVTGSFTPSGLTIGGVFTEVTLSAATWTPLPAVPQAGRNTINIYNYTGWQIKLNYISTTLPAGYSGSTVVNTGSAFYGISDSIIIYAKLEPGATGALPLDVEELA